MCELERSELDRALDELVESGLLIRRGSRPGVTYIFKHALLQDASYNSLLLEKRRPLHSRIAETLTAQSPDQAAILAHHWEGAENFELALHHRLEAAEAGHQALRVLGSHRSVFGWPSTSWIDCRRRRRHYERHVDTVLAIIRVMGIAGSVYWQNEQQRRRALRHVDKAIRTATGGGNLAFSCSARSIQG